MKTKIFLSLAIMVITAACKKETSETPENTTTVVEETKVEIPKTECYSYDANGNLVEMRLQYKGNDANGTLNYGLAEKDSNMGTFTGKIENDVLLADYTFQSEGTESRREVAFKVEGKSLVEGYGELNEDGTAFKDTKNLNFSSTMPLTKIDCDKK